MWRRGTRAGFGPGDEKRGFIPPTAPHFVLRAPSVLDGFKVGSFLHPAGVDVSQTKKDLRRRGRKRGSR